MRPLSTFVHAAGKQLGSLASFRSKGAAKDGKVRKPRRESDAAERAIRQSERRYRILVQSTSDIITLIGADGTVHYESSALERVMGYRSEDQVGTNAFDWVHPDDVERALGLLAEILRPLVSIRQEQR